jgi:hypothetical protein
MTPSRSALHIVIIVPGSSPEEAFARALAHLGTERRLPHEIHVIAVRPVLDEVRPLLSGDGASRVTQLCATAGFPRDEILLNGRTLHAIDEPAHELTGAVDRVLQVLRPMTAGAASSLTAFVSHDAGAAGHLLQVALRIAGRVEDRLLLDVSGPRGRQKGARESEPSNRRYVELPLLLWRANEPQPASFAEALRHRRLERLRAVQSDPLRLDVRRRDVSVGETSIHLPAMQFFWLYYLAAMPGERFPLAEITHVGAGARRQSIPVTQRLSDGRVRVFPTDLQRAFVYVFPQGADKFEAMFHRACGPHPGLPSTISKINAALRRALGRGATPYLIQGGRGAGGYRVTLSPSAIQIVETKRA